MMPEASMLEELPQEAEQSIAKIKEDLATYSMG